jgi:TRAP-type C4-dicarboxylate transport system permease small subunit
MGASARSDGEAGRKPWTVLVACVLLFAVATLMVVWGSYTLSRAGEFGAAAYRFSDSHQDVDLAPGLFELAFVGGAIVSILLAFTLRHICRTYRVRLSPSAASWS